MFSGYLQAGLHSSMNGRHGLAGWRWLFILDAIISVPVAIWGFFGLPDTPHTTRAFYWSSEVGIPMIYIGGILTTVSKHIRYGIERIEKIGHREQPKLTWKEAKRVYLRWELWVFVATYTYYPFRK